MLTIVGIIGLLATASLFAQSPTGQVMQEQGVYISEDQANLAIECENRLQQVIFLGYQANYGVWCCPEDMNGQNECRFPKRILITRTY